MTKVLVDISMSLDGFVAGPNDELDRIHRWMFEGRTEQNTAVAQEYINGLGAVVMGRRTFDTGVKINGWSAWVDTPPYEVPIFIPSHHVPEGLEQGKTAFTVVTEGIESAVNRAKAAVLDMNVAIMGGAHTIQQGLKAGLVDEMHIHLVPVLLGQGIRLFDPLSTDKIDLETIRVIETPEVTHFSFRVVK